MSETTEVAAYGGAGWSARKKSLCDEIGEIWRASLFLQVFQEGISKLDACEWHLKAKLYLLFKLQYKHTSARGFVSDGIKLEPPSSNY